MIVLIKYLIKVIGYILVISFNMILNRRYHFYLKNLIWMDFIITYIIKKVGIYIFLIIKHKWENKYILNSKKKDYARGGLYT